MNIITKSGDNTYHGELFEFFRNDALDANDYFETSKQPLRLNQFGGNLGGPIVKNKLFFFVNYEGDRTHITTFNALNHTLSAYARSQFVPAMQPVSGAVCASSGWLHCHSRARFMRVSRLPGWE